MTSISMMHNGQNCKEIDGNMRVEQGMQMRLDVSIKDVK